MIYQGGSAKSGTRDYVDVAASWASNVITSIVAVMVLFVLICLIFYPCVLYVIALCTMSLCKLVIGFLWKLVLKTSIHWIERDIGRS